MKSPVAFLLFVLCVAAFGEREIRFWVGDRNNRVASKSQDYKNHLAHIEFIRNALGPGTLVAGRGALDYYSIYIPRQEVNKNLLTQTLPAEAMLRTLPFTEAALPSYESAEAYQKSRADHPEYGPLHGKENGFDLKRSYSATPKRLEDREIRSGIAISQSQPAEARVAYDLRASFNADPDWTKGTTIVWLVLRRRDVEENEYRQAIAAQFKKFTRDGYLEDYLVDGHYARVDEGFILHFLNVPERGNIKEVLLALGKAHHEALSPVIPGSSSTTMNDYAIEFEKVVAESREPFSAGWDKSIAPGKAVNVQLGN